MPTYATMTSRLPSLPSKIPVSTRRDQPRYYNDHLSDGILLCLRTQNTHMQLIYLPMLDILPEITMNETTNNEGL